MAALPHRSTTNLKRSAHVVARVRKHASAGSWEDSEAELAASDLLTATSDWVDPSCEAELAAVRDIVGRWRAKVGNDYDKSKAEALARQRAAENEEERVRQSAVERRAMEERAAAEAREVSEAGDKERSEGEMADGKTVAGTVTVEWSGVSSALCGAAVFVWASCCGYRGLVFFRWFARTRAARLFLRRRVQSHNTPIPLVTSLSLPLLWCACSLRGACCSRCCVLEWRRRDRGGCACASGGPDHATTDVVAVLAHS